jgi:hypothetical protein
MKFQIESLQRLRGTATVALAALLGIFGCSSPPKPSPPEASSAITPASPSVPDLKSAANCIVSSMQNPKESFHVSLSRKDDDLAYAFSSDADFTADTLEGTTNWGSGSDTRKLSGARSDANAWDVSVMHLAGPLISSALNDFILVQSTTASAGDDPVGGYDSIKYVFDTASLAPPDKARFAARLKAKDFSVTGAAWITKGTLCMVKYVTDYNFTAENGTLGSVHNEGSIVKR